MIQRPSISIVIPTFNRGQVLLDTIDFISKLSELPLEFIIVDQTVSPTQHVKQKLEEHHSSGLINWIVLERPSVVAAMNVGLVTAQSDYVLFLDDDIKPCDNLLKNYIKLISKQHCGIVAGRVIQPWDNPEGDHQPETFSFNSLTNGDAPFFIGANVLINRSTAIQLGGFDENFIGTAHDYEREFSDRVLGANHNIAYCGKAAVHHLKEEAGGIRTYGHFLKTVKPHHAVGAYYYILRSKRVHNKALAVLKRLKQRVATRTHLKQPWWIPLTLIGDILGIIWALKLRLSGPKLIGRSDSSTQ